MARYHITLQRMKEYEDITKPNKTRKEGSTIGEFKVVDTENGEVLFQCFSVENEGESTATPKLDKRILPRIYHLEWTESGVALPKSWKPKCITTTCPTDPAHKGRRIHIHIGNYPQDTEGCILLNTTDNKNGTCSGSTQAIEQFYSIVAKLGIENFELEVREIGQ